MQRGFSAVFLLVGIVLLLVVLVGGYFATRINLESFPEKGKACTLEAKICPDGTSVGRSGPNCEFAACPSVKRSTTASGSAETTNWKTYTSPNGQISFQYPGNWIEAYGSDTFGTTFRYSVADGDESRIEETKIIPPQYKNLFEVSLVDYKSYSANPPKNEEEIIKSHLSYDVNSTSSWANEEPQLIENTQLTIGGKKAYTYEFKLNKPLDNKFNRLVKYYIPAAPNIYDITMLGDDKETFQKILSSLKLK